MARGSFCFINGYGLRLVDSSTVRNNMTKNKLKFTDDERNSILAK